MTDSVLYSMYTITHTVWQRVAECVTQHVFHHTYSMTAWQYDSVTVWLTVCYTACTSLHTQAWQRVADRTRPHLELLDVVGRDVQADADGDEEEADDEEGGQHGARREDGRSEEHTSELQSQR